MFREMRRNRQLLCEAESVEILMNGTSGVLALAGDDGYPYAVPVSYVYDDGKLYFHSAKEGHKVDAIRSCEKASFCVIAQDDVVPEEYTTYFKSVIAFGKIRILEEEQEIGEAIEKLAVRYYPKDSRDHRREVITEAAKRMHMIELSVEHMTGKEAIELVGMK